MLLIWFHTCWKHQLFTKPTPSQFQGSSSQCHMDTASANRISRHDASANRRRGKWHAMFDVTRREPAGWWFTVQRRTLRRRGQVADQGAAAWWNPSRPAAAVEEFSGSLRTFVSLLTEVGPSLLFSSASGAHRPAVGNPDLSRDTRLLSAPNPLLRRTPSGKDQELKKTKHGRLLPFHVFGHFQRGIDVRSWRNSE